MLVLATGVEASAFARFLVGLVMVPVGNDVPEIVEGTEPTSATMQEAK